MNRMEGPAQGSSPQAALNELLGTSGGYSARKCKLASFRAGSVSLPDHAGAVSLAEMLPAAERTKLESFERSPFVSPDTFNVRSRNNITPYWDPLLKSHRSVYLEFLLDLRRRSMLRFTTRPRGHVGVFFVGTKNGALRLIIDARCPNMYFIDSPYMALVSGNQFAEIELEGPDCLYIAQQDVQDCYHQFWIPEELSRMFCLLPIRASELGIDSVDGVGVSSETLVYPCCRTLPMGFALSAFWVQTIHESLLGDIGCRPDQQFRDHCPLPRLPDGGHVVYLDNEAMISTDMGWCNDNIIAARARLTGCGLPVHEEAAASTCQTLLGISFDGERGLVSICPGRLWKIRLATLGLLKRRGVSGAQLEVLVGHYVHCFLLCRPALSVFRSSYDFIQKHRDSPARLWPQIRAELRAASALLVVCVF